MTKSSKGLVLLFAGWSVVAEAEPPAAGLVTADEAMKHYHETFGVADRERNCPRTGADEEIVVCGGASQHERLPLPIEREPGEIVRHVNEPMSTTAALGAGCTRTCAGPATNNVLVILFQAPKVIRHILHPDDD